MRLRDWNERLNEVVLSARIKPFEWGVHDCGVFTADCIKAITNVDYAQAFRGYQSALGAEHIVSQYGGLSALVDQITNTSRVHRSHARRGDLVLGLPPESDVFGGSLGICLGVKFAFVDRIGLSMQGIDVVQIAWSIN